MRGGSREPKLGARGKKLNKIFAEVSKRLEKNMGSITMGLLDAILFLPYLLSLAV